jgi:hypothetical protein
MRIARPSIALVTTVALAAPMMHANDHTPDSFASHLALLRDHFTVIVLRDGDARIAVTADLQGRVMTSTNGGDAGPSFGWLNHALIAEGIVPEDQRHGRLEAHIHVFGGEDRFWLGPEGGQFALYFPPGTPRGPFEFDRWRVPAAIDTEPFDLVRHDDHEAVFTREMALTNASGTRFDLRVDRTVRLLTHDKAAEAFGIDLPPPGSLPLVAYESDNAITNTGDDAWSPDTGLLSIWILGMYRPSPTTIMAIPVRPGDEAELGPAVNDDYFGRIPQDHLRVEGNVIYFRGDGTRRGKIGVSPERSRHIAGSYSPDLQTLTLVNYGPQPAPHGYVNSAWAHQDQPFVGDVINAYNDGPPMPGADPLGPFYELETSSPAAALAPGQTMRHVHRTLHLTGPAEALDGIARQALGVGIDTIQRAFDTSEENR